MTDDQLDGERKHYFELGRLEARLETHWFEILWGFLIGIQVGYLFFH